MSATRVAPSRVQASVPGRRTGRTVALVFALLLPVVAPTLQAADGQATAGTSSLLHPVFQDHAVLQRDRPLRIHGQAPPGTRVRVALADRLGDVHADAGGHWEATLPALPAGGPHVLQVRTDTAEQRVEDVLVGDVWLCAGQSNMELQVWRSLDARAEIAGAGSDAIRLLTVPQVGHPSPQAGFGAPVAWRTVSPDSVRDFSAACFYFARALRETVDVPMGLISAAWGGSRIQAWTSGDALREAGADDDALGVLDLYRRDPAAAAARWGAIWAGWWHDREGVAADDAPWRAASDAGIGDGWLDAPRDLGAWEQWGLPDLADYDGLVWYRTTVQLEAGQAARQAVLALGPADEMDTTWVNGTAVGSTYGAGLARAYALPPGLLRAGDNTVVVAVLDTYRDGGLSGPATAHRLQFDDGTSVPLDGGWRYRVAPGRDWPPRAPWQDAAGLSTLYNGMIAPLAGIALRGALWYQGESDTGEADAYADRLRVLRDDWRSRFGSQLPFLVVQLANFGQPFFAPGDSDWATLREAQRRVADEDAASALAVAIDIGDRYDIHPPNKQELGRRLARAARHVVYADPVPASGPTPRSARREGDAVVVGFAGIDGGLVVHGAAAPVGFELCGAAAGSCRYADARVQGDTVVLRAADVSAPVRVRHAWADSPMVNLFDRAGLPVGPFEIAIGRAAR